MMFDRKSILENIKTLFYALIIALIIRSLFLQPFYIPSSSMEPSLLVGDRLFVTKYSYGYSKHSFPFSPNITNKRFFSKPPKKGDLVVFKTPADNRTDYIKRLIGLPGDTIQFINWDIFLNNKKIIRKKIKDDFRIRCGNINLKVNSYEETLPNGVKYKAVYSKVGTLINSDKYIVPKDHFFVMGDNRDNSQDSRYIKSVGFIPFDNLVGRAELIFFSWNWRKIGQTNCKTSVEWERILKRIKWIIYPIKLI